jgi:hypothetical protein
MTNGVGPNVWDSVAPLAGSVGDSNGGSNRWPMEAGLQLDPAIDARSSWRMMQLVECPFCSSETSEGRMAVVSWNVSTPTRVMWKPAESRQEEAQLVFAAGLFNRRTRSARYCYGCDAVLVEPLVP